jgi:hypothetical protein
VAEDCTGSSADCPADAFYPSDHECRAAAGSCDVAEDCTGSSVDCPADGFQPNGTECPDGLFCNGTDTCLDGSCASHSGDPCDPGEECVEETDQCVPTGDDTGDDTDDDSGDDTSDDTDDDTMPDDDVSDDDSGGGANQSSDSGGTSCCGG